MCFEIHSFSQVKTVRVEPADTRNKPHLQTVIFWHIGPTNQIIRRRNLSTIDGYFALHTKSNVTHIWGTVEAAELGFGGRE